MPAGRLPVRPDLEQLRHQARDLLRAIHRGDADALADLREFHPEQVDPASAQLADAQLVLARSYQASSWTRLKQSCDLIDAIWRDDIDAVRSIVTANPQLLHEHAGIRNNNWGFPLSYAANIGRDRIIIMLHELGATDLQYALDRAALQGQESTVRLLHRLLGSPKVPDDVLGGTAYTLSVTGTRLALELGAKVVTSDGRRIAPVDVVLETDSRKPEAKHTILALYEQHGLSYPDTPVMALHRGRIDLLEAHIRHEPAIINQRFTHEEIHQPELGCHDEVLATHGTPLDGTTLLHMCADYDELEIARWLLERGADVNARATVQPDGFGGHTPLFSTVVSQANFWPNYQRRPESAPFTALFLKHGADPTVRASLRKQLHPGYNDDRVMEYRDVTALEWGERFHQPVFVSRAALEMLRR
ncbi:MAG TPA: ankyrin repeat domain-containing protein [Gemmatimonadales bacterium]|nr:ankyrin repeat domain-containing protein [Gemmatimonadales bacterium]